MKGAGKIRAGILAMGIRADGCKEVLRLWIKHTAGAKCWLKVFTDAQSGLRRYFDGRRGWIAWLPDATQPSIQTPKFKPAVSICSGTHWPLPTGKSANLQAPRLSRFTRRPIHSPSYSRNVLQTQ